MNYTEALEHYLAYIQNEDYEIPEEALKALGLGVYNENEIQTVGDNITTTGTTVPTYDVTNLSVVDGYGNHSEFGLLSYLFGNTVYNTLENTPLLLRKTTTQNAKFPTSGTDLYSGPVTNLNSLSLPITNAVNNRGFWVDLQGNPGSSQIVSCVAYIDSERVPHICVVGLDSSFKPVNKWVDLTEKTSGGSGPELEYETVNIYEGENAYFTGFTASLPSLNISNISAMEGVSFYPSITYTGTTLNIGAHIVVDLNSSSTIATAFSKLSKYGIIKHPEYPALEFGFTGTETPSIVPISQEFNFEVSGTTAALHFGLLGTAEEFSEDYQEYFKAGNIYINFNDCDFTRIYA